MKEQAQRNRPQGDGASAAVSRFLNPASIALLGASEDQSKFGGRLLRMLLKHRYAGRVLPINPARGELFGLKACASLDQLEGAPDLVVFTVPADKVLEQIEQAGRLGTRAALVISAGFSDAGEQGLARERQLLEISARHGMRVMGPNCLGVVSAPHQLVLCSSPILEIDRIPSQPIGFVSQSGALMTTYFDRAWAMGGGFTHGFSVGNQADLELCDFVDFLIDDHATRVICTYIEGVKHATRFRNTARRAAAAGKPWLAVKAGRSSAGSAAAFSHTASVAGDHAVFEAVCREEGVTLLDDMGAMLLLANSMWRDTTRAVRKVAIVSPSGGGGALGADALADQGVALSSFADATRAALAPHYPKGQADNPVDLGARSTQDPKVVAEATLAAMDADDDTDVVLVTSSMCPQEWVDGLVEVSTRADAAATSKPVIYVFEAGVTSQGMRDKLAARGYAFSSSSLEAARAIAGWKRRSDWQPRRTPERPSQCGPLADMPRGTLDEARSKALLAQYGLPVNAGRLATSAEDAADAAAAMGFPVVMKIVSPDIVHKTEAGGVALNLRSADEAASAYARLIANARAYKADAHLEGVLVQAMAQGEVELLIGARSDPQFGPMVVFGAGGVLVELLADRVVASAPLAAQDVGAALDALPIGHLLNGYRGRTLDRDGVIDAIVRVSWLANDLRVADFELDINPLMVARERCIAVDARLQIR
ncbi:acetate--CoA ligase family protein [Diaphorobacter caeni]|uniref:acetate--CoA ligase family protein n=1 Tax=Diaphorobacter caeni TaxID=2784387 RepID=UPI00188E0C6D|nr:acetate--CoA ligase family protein [Diaphorobacter caeni]MBF5005072.1 acetate--CoA ligase family protein [Diaphorobacter caeni]